MKGFRSVILSFSFVDGLLDSIYVSRRCCLQRKELYRTKTKVRSSNQSHIELAMFPSPSPSCNELHVSSSQCSGMAVTTIGILARRARRATM